MSNKAEDFMPSEARIREITIARNDRERLINATRPINCQRIRDELKRAIDAWDFSTLNNGEPLGTKVKLIQPFDYEFVKRGNRMSWISQACDIPFAKINDELSRRLETPTKLFVGYPENTSNNELLISLQRLDS